MIMIAKEPQPPIRPPVAFRVVVCYGSFAPDNPGPASMSDRAVFANPADVIAYRMQVESAGGKVVSVHKIIAPQFWYESLDQFNRLGTMTAAELKEWRLRCEAAIDCDAAGVEVVIDPV